MIGLLNKLNEYLEKTEVLIVQILSGLLALIMICQVILRYLFRSPLFWAEEISLQLLVFMTFFGFSLLLKRGRLIAIDTLTTYLSKKINSGLSAIFDVLGLVVIVFFAYQATLWILRPEVRLDVSPTTHLPTWYNYTALPIALYAMTFHQAIAILNRLKPSKGE